MKRGQPPLVRFMEKVTKAENGCWIWTGANRGNGYGAFKYRGKILGTHVVSYLLNIGEIPAGMVVMHTCDVKLCVNPRHLKLGTQRENWEDAVSKGRMSRRKIPVINPLTSKQIKQIVTDFESGVTMRTLSLKYDVPKTSLRRLLIKHSEVAKLERLEQLRARPRPAN